MHYLARNHDTVGQSALDTNSNQGVLRTLTVSYVHKYMYHAMLQCIHWLSSWQVNRTMTRGTDISMHVTSQYNYALK